MDVVDFRYMTIDKIRVCNDFDRLLEFDLDFEIKIDNESLPLLSRSLLGRSQPLIAEVRSSLASAKKSNI